MSLVDHFPRRANPEHVRAALRKQFSPATADAAIALLDAATDFELGRLAGMFLVAAHAAENVATVPDEHEQRHLRWAWTVSATDECRPGDCIIDRG